jgi:hypothetical protein
MRLSRPGVIRGGFFIVRATRPSVGLAGRGAATAFPCPSGVTQQSPAKASELLGYAGIGLRDRYTVTVARC